MQAVEKIQKSEIFEKMLEITLNDILIPPNGIFGIFDSIWAKYNYAYMYTVVWKTHRFERGYREFTFVGGEFEWSSVQRSEFNP